MVATAPTFNANTFRFVVTPAFTSGAPCVAFRAATATKFGEPAATTLSLARLSFSTRI
jgi:hypothetical protein